MKEKAVLVIGAAGTLGNLICKEIIEKYQPTWHLHIGDYKSERGQQLAKQYQASFALIDVFNKEHMLNLLQSIDAVIVAIKQDEPLIQEFCFQTDTVCVDVTAFVGFANKVQQSFQMYSDTKTHSVVMAGFFPGLSGVLFKEAACGMDCIKHADITLIQNISAVAGITGMMDMFTIIHQPTHYGFGNKKNLIKGFTKKNVVKLKTLKKTFTVRLIHHSEKEWLMKGLPLTNIHYWTGWNSCIFSQLIYWFNNTKWFDKWIHKPDHPFLKKIRKNSKPKDETAYMVVSAHGLQNGVEKKAEWHVKTFSDYGLTAIMATTVTDLTLKMNLKGVFHPADILTWDDLSSRVTRKNVVISKI